MVTGRCIPAAAAVGATGPVTLSGRGCSGVSAALEVLRLAAGDVAGLAAGVVKALEVDPVAGTTGGGSSASFTYAVSVVSWSPSPKE